MWTDRRLYFLIRKRKKKRSFFAYILFPLSLRAPSSMLRLCNAMHKHTQIQSYKHKLSQESSTKDNNGKNQSIWWYKSKSIKFNYRFGLKVHINVFSKIRKSNEVKSKTKQKSWRCPNNNMQYGYSNHKPDRRGKRMRKTKSEEVFLRQQ